MTKTKAESNKGAVVLYKNRVEVRLDQDTVWLTQKQMAELFDKDVSTINEHTINIFKEKELQKPATIRNFRIVQKEGEREVSREVDFYNAELNAGVPEVRS